MTKTESKEQNTIAKTNQNVGLTKVKENTILVKPLTIVNE